MIVDTSNFIVNGNNNKDINIISGVGGTGINLGCGSLGFTLTHLSDSSQLIYANRDDITLLNDINISIEYDSILFYSKSGSKNLYIGTEDSGKRLGAINIEANDILTLKGSDNKIEINNNDTIVIDADKTLQIYANTITGIGDYGNGVVIVSGPSKKEFIISESDITYDGTSLVNPSATITHRAPIDENLTQNDFEIGKPVYMTGKVYVKESSEVGWKHSDSIDNVIDCISSVKHTGTWREYLGICVGKYKIRVGLEENEITFASHGDFMVKYSECNVGDTLYVTDDGNINVLNDETPLTLKIQRQIIGLVTEKINDEYCAVFKSN